MAYDRRMTRRSNRVSAGTGRLLPVLAFSLLSASAAALEPRDEGGRFDPGGPAMGVREPPRAVAAQSPDRIIRQIEKKYDARVVRQEMKDRKGRRILVLRLDDGRKVWKVEVDPETGKEL